MFTNNVRVEVEAVEVHCYTGVLVVEACLLVLVGERHTLEENTKNNRHRKSVNK